MHRDRHSADADRLTVRDQLVEFHSSAVSRTFNSAASASMLFAAQGETITVTLRSLDRSRVVVLSSRQEDCQFFLRVLKAFREVGGLPPE